jgi:hypothetical protein
MSDLLQTAARSSSPDRLLQGDVSTTVYSTISSMEDIADAVRSAIDGEDSFDESVPDGIVAAKTGVLPVEEYVAGAEAPDPQADAPDEIELKPISAGEKGRLLSKMPAEALHAALSALYNNDWWQEELEVIIEDLALMDIRIDPGGLSRLSAMRSILRSPAERSAFHSYPGSFAFFCSSLSGRPIRLGEDDPTPTPVEMALAMHIVSIIRPDRYSESVLGYIAATCLAQHVWVLPSPLDLVQEYLYRIAEYADLPISEEDVKSVKAIAENLPPDDSEPDTLFETQARRYVEVDTRITTQIRLGDEAASKIWRKLGERITGVK